MANRLIKSTHFSRNCFFLFRNFYIAIDPEQIRNIFFPFLMFLLLLLLLLSLLLLLLFQGS